MSNQEKVLEIETKNKNMYYVLSALTLAGGVAGVLYGVKKKKSFLTKVGYYFLGSAILGIPSGIIIVPKINKNVAKVKTLKGKSIPVDESGQPIAQTKPLFISSNA